MGYEIDQIEGIGPTSRLKLQAAGIRTTGDLLRSCCSPSGRKEVAEKSGIVERTLLKWTNMADLMRISGVARQYAELLEASGVDTVTELRTRNAERLTNKMREINAQRKLTRVTPSVSVVEGWVVQARRLDPRISH